MILKIVRASSQLDHNLRPTTNLSRQFLYFARLFKKPPQKNWTSYRVFEIHPDNKLSFFKLSFNFRFFCPKLRDTHCIFPKKSEYESKVFLIFLSFFSKRRCYDVVLVHFKLLHFPFSKSSFIVFFFNFIPKFTVLSFAFRKCVREHRKFGGYS